MTNLCVQTKTFWFAAVSFFEKHHCKVWFGTPTQVWSRSISDTVFIPVSHIKSRTAHVFTNVYFGRVIGNDYVLVVVPLVNDMQSISYEQ